MENQNNQNKASENQNNRKPDNRGNSQSKVQNNGQDKKVSIRIGGNKNRGQNNGQIAAAKGKEAQKTNDKAAQDNQAKEKAEHRYGQQGRFGRNNSRSHHESLNRSARTKREETLDDIRADIEQIEKDIQFEIKQIRSIKLGL